MTQADAEAVASWHYPEPYAFYDWTADPDDLAELLDPASGERGGYHAVDDDAGELVGFFACTASEGLVQIGLGLCPACTGRGLGGSFLAAALDCSRERFAPTEFTLSVAAFNQRAITVYERAGFQTVRAFRHRTHDAEWEFVEMRRGA
jgi:ribosomal-protein-alanine N-acetyltransferase